MNPTVRLLYAEDNAQDADLTLAHFAEHAPDFSIEIVGTGQRCLARLREAAFDLLLLDQRLPDMDGLELLKALGRERIAVPVVLVTGMGDEELVSKALRLGAADYVPKQGHYLDGLAEQLRAVLRTRHRGQGLGLPGATTVRRVLYVEHLPMDIELMLSHLAEAAPYFEVEVARSCAAALHCLASAAPERYDLVLIDLRMPDQDGLDFVREAQRSPRPMPPFLMLSGNGDDAIAIAAMRLGAADYMTKRDGYLQQLPNRMELCITQDRLRHRNEQLRGELAERTRLSESLRASLREKEALLNEVHHRVKNNMQVIVSLLRLESTRSDNPGVKAVLHDMQGRIQSMALLNESLYRTGSYAEIDLGSYLKDLSALSFRAQTTRHEGVRLVLDLAAVQVGLDQANACGLLVNELVSNGLKHGFADGREGELRVELLALDAAGLMRLRVSDTGAGLPPDFAARRELTLGLKLVSDLVTQMGGELHTGPGPAAVFSVTFKVAEPRPLLAASATAEGLATP